LGMVEFPEVPFVAIAPVLFVSVAFAPVLFRRFVNAVRRDLSLAIASRGEIIRSHSQRALVGEMTLCTLYGSSMPVLRVNFSLACAPHSASTPKRIPHRISRGRA
jgi:hypothetical protein